MIYAIGMGDGLPIKFGRARSPRKRLASLQGGSPHQLSLLASVDLPDVCEVLIHIYLKESYIRGEWFEPSALALGLVELMKSGDVVGIEDRIGRHHHNPRLDKEAYRRTFVVTGAEFKADGWACRWPS